MYTRHPNIPQRLSLVLAILIVAFGLMPCAVARAEGEYVPGEVVVVYEDASAPVEQTETELANSGYAVTEQITSADASDVAAAVAEVPNNTSVEQAVEELTAMPGVAFAQPNYVYQLPEPIDEVTANALDINDYYYRNDMARHLELSSVLEAWELAQTNGSVGVAVLDTGCRMNHEDLTANLDWLNAWDFITNSANGGQRLALSLSSSDCGDENGHGTHVCGIVGASVNNNLGTAGVSHNASIVPMRILNAQGRGSTDTVMKALNKVVELNETEGTNIRVVNLSLGGEGTDAALDALITQLANKGILCVCAAGNESSTEPTVPSDCTDSLAVMAVDKDKCHTYYTNYKTSSDVNVNKTVSAMGGSAKSYDDYVWSTYKGSNSDYSGLVGTSQATPIVSGAAALMFAANPGLNVRRVRELLVTTTDEVNHNGSYATKDSSSAGLLNSYRAVAAAKGATLFSVASPEAVEGLVYAGVEQAGVMGNQAYTLTTQKIADGAGVVVASTQPYEGAKATEAGTYRTTAHLVAGYTWDDETSADKTVDWSIAKAPLTATYEPCTVRVGVLVPTEMQVTGFANSETALTAQGYEAPAIDFGGARDESTGKAILPEGEDVHVYETTISGGSANNYFFNEYAQGNITVVRKLAVPIPSGSTFTYNGRQQTGVPTNAGYVVAEGVATAKDAGEYTTVLALSDTGSYVWEDGTTDNKTVEWIINKARLDLRFNGGATWRTDLSGTPAQIGMQLTQLYKDSITVTSPVTAERVTSLPGFKLPALWLMTSNSSGQGINSVEVVDGKGVGAQEITTLVRPNANVLGEVGVKALVPITKGTEDASEEELGNPTDNYEFFRSYSGNLVVYDKAIVPTVANHTYTGATQVGVTGGSHCTIQGTTQAVNAGTYTATAVLNSYYQWSDKNPGDLRVNRTLTWRIDARSLAGAAVTLPTTRYTYTGSAIQPNPTVVLDGHTLAKGTDYTVSYANNTNAGTARVTITGKGNYQGTATASFTIAKAMLTATYAGGSIYAGAAAPTTVTVTGFVGGQSAAKAAGYKAPTVSVSAAQRNTPGTYTITPGRGAATNYSFTYRPGTLRVLAVPVSSVSLSQTQAWLGVGKSTALTATVAPSNATNKAVSWRSSNGGVATVNALGVVTGLVPGTAQITATAGGRTATCTVTVGIPAATVAYQTHVQRVGWQGWKRNGGMSGTSGRSLRLEGIHVRLEGAQYAGGIEYRTHVQKIGWQGFVRDGAMAGTSRRSLRLEAIEIRLYGQMASYYDVYYRVHCQKFGWMGWAKNGQRSGSAGYSRRLEGIQIVIVPKGQPAPGATYAGITQRFSDCFRQRR